MDRVMLWLATPTKKTRSLLQLLWQDCRLHEHIQLTQPWFPHIHKHGNTLKPQKKAWAWISNTSRKELTLVHITISANESNLGCQNNLYNPSLCPKVWWKRKKIPTGMEWYSYTKSWTDHLKFCHCRNINNSACWHTIYFHFCSVLLEAALHTPVKVMYYKDLNVVQKSSMHFLKNQTFHGCCITV